MRNPFRRRAPVVREADASVRVGDIWYDRRSAAVLERIEGRVAFRGVTAGFSRIRAMFRSSGEPQAESRAVTSVPWSVGAPSTSSVSQERALRLIPVYAAVRLIADLVSTLPLKAYREDGNVRQPMARLPQLFQQLDDAGTLPDWLHRCMTSLLLRGNAYGIITERDGMQFPTVIQWLNPDDVHCDDLNPWAPIWYWKGRVVPTEDFVHIPWFTIAGKVQGLSPIEAYATTVNVGLQAQSYASGWFDNGGVPPGTFKNTAKTVSVTESDEIKDRLVRAIQSRKPIVYGSDWDYNPISISPEQAQFVQTARLTASQIAAIYGVPPDMIGGEKGGSYTYSSPEQNSLQLSTLTLRPWLVKLERKFSALLAMRQQIKFNADAIVRADLASRMAAYQVARNIGLRSIDELRALEDLPPLPNGQGQSYAPPPQPVPQPQSRRYNPNQPRDPGGQGGGQWVENPAGAAADAAKTAASVLDAKTLSEGTKNNHESAALASSRLADAWKVQDADLEALAREDGIWPHISHLSPKERRQHYAESLILRSQGESGGPEMTAALTSVVDKLGGTFELDGGRGRVNKFIRSDPAMDRATRSLGEAVYKQTQDWFKERGITHVRAYRASRGADFDAKQPYTSWSAGKGTIRLDGDRELRDEVIPVERIASIPTTGFGSIDELELVVLNESVGSAKGARGYNPSQPRDPGGAGGGQWVKNPAGAAADAATHIVADELDIADVIDLEPDEHLILSDVFYTRGSEYELNAAIIVTANGSQVRLGVTNKDDLWHGDSSDTIHLESDQFRKLHADLNNAAGEGKKAAAAANKAWNSGSGPKDPRLTGAEAVVAGSVQDSSTDLQWDVFITDDDPTSWELTVRTEDTSGLTLNPRETAKLLKFLQVLEDHLDAPAASRANPRLAILDLYARQFDPDDALAGADSRKVRDRNQLKDYWLHGEGAAKWSTFDELYDHLKKYVPAGKAKRIAASWFHARYGYWPGSDKNRVAHGKKPRGKLVGPG